LKTIKKRLLLISNSTLYGGGYLDHAEMEIRTFWGGSPVLFIPRAARPDTYAALAAPAVAAMGYEMDPP